MFISKKKNALPRNLKFQIYNTEITSQSSDVLQGVTIYNELKFGQQISRLCKSVRCQLNTRFRLINYLNYEKYSDIFAHINQSTKYRVYKRGLCNRCTMTSKATTPNF